MLSASLKCSLIWLSDFSFSLILRVNSSPSNFASTFLCPSPKSYLGTYFTHFSWGFFSTQFLSSIPIHEINRCLLFGRKAMTNLKSIFKSRDIILQTQVHLIKAMVFPVVMYGCESWSIKKAEHQRIGAFELWCWRKPLRVLGLQGDQTSQSSRKSLLNILWKDWCWSWNSNTLATWCKELTH